MPPRSGRAQRLPLQVLPEAEENAPGHARSRYSADPSAHVFNGKIYIYPSHDFDSGIPSDDLGNQYAMKDYQVLSMDSIGGPVTQ